MAATPVTGTRLLLFKGGAPIKILIFFICLYSSHVWAQGTKEDYLRAESLQKKVEGKMLYAPSTFRWLEKENKFWYVNNTPRGKEFLLVDADKRTSRPAFDQEKLSKSLASASGTKVEPYHLPFSTITFVQSNKEIEFESEGKLWRYSLISNKLQDMGKVEPRERPNRYWGSGADESGNKPVSSPDDKWEAFVKNYNVYIRSVQDKKEEYQLSFDGSAGEYYSSYFSWSPDSKKLATNKIRANKEHLIYFVESSPSDQLQPKLHTRNYLKPGDALPQKKPQLFLVGTKKQLEVDASLLEDQYSLSNPVWRKDSRSFTFEYNQRGHQVYKVLEVEATSGKVKELIGEESKTFIDYSGKKYRYDAEDGKSIIWASERDGWNHLYLYDGMTGKLKNQITKGEWVVRSVVYVDEANQKIIFEGSGKEAGQDPYLIQYYSVGFDGTGLVALTKEDANHKAVFSPDYKYFVDTYSRVDVPPVTVLRNAADGKVMMEVEKADVAALLKSGWRAPEVFTAKGRDGQTDIWGIIVRPTNFEASKKYPVIEYIYAGPQSSFVPKTFNPNSRMLQELAELGFIVVQIDGMGTSNRSKAFHDVCWKDLKDAGFPDRIGWIKAAAHQYPYMDLEKVGIFGTSAGGQNSAGAVLFHPDFYKVAVSSAGCHDNRMDKMWWNEQWMGKLGPHYAASSNVEHAHKLKGKLMLILGELDDNVDPASTLQVVNALIKANKNFEFLMVPGMGHSSGGDYGEHKRRDFFVKHLLGIEPPAWESNDTVMEQSAVGLSK